MKFTKEEMLRLSPLALADYLQARGWCQDEDVPAKGTVWIYHDEKGNVYEIMLPNNRALGDFAIRMSEAIHTLEMVENRSEREIFVTLREIEALPSEIIEGEIAAGELGWDVSEKQKLEPLLEALDENAIERTRERFLFCLAEFAETIAAGKTLIGDDASSKTSLLEICRRVLPSIGLALQDGASPSDLWNAARLGKSETWLEHNSGESPESPGNTPAHERQSHRN